MLVIGAPYRKSLWSSSTRSGTDHSPYIDFPKNWPVFSLFKDKNADWLEMYKGSREFLGTARAPRPAGPAGDRRPKRNGKCSVVDARQRDHAQADPVGVCRPHTSAKPNMPQFKGMDTFKGEQHHSLRHPGPTATRGKKVVVIGLLAIPRMTHLRRPIRRWTTTASSARPPIVVRFLHFVMNSRADLEFLACRPRRHDDGQSCIDFASRPGRYSISCRSRSTTRSLQGRRRFLCRANKAGFRARFS